MPYSARSFHDRRHDQQIGPISPAQAVKLNSREEAEGHRGRQPVISTWKVWGKLDIKKNGIDRTRKENFILHTTPPHRIQPSPCYCNMQHAFARKSPFLQPDQTNTKENSPFCSPFSPTHKDSRLWCRICETLRLISRTEKEKRPSYSAV